MTAPRQPMQPVYLDKSGVVRFVPNKILRWLVDTACVDLDKIAAKDFPAADKEQFWQLLGFGIDNFSGLPFVRPNIAAEATRSAVRLLRDNVGKLPWRRVETGWYQASHLGHVFMLRLERCDTEGSYRLSARQVQKLDHLRGEMMAAISGLTWVARMDGKPIALRDGGSTRGAVGSLADGKKRISDWCQVHLKGD